MTINQVYQELEELEQRYNKALNNIALLEKKLHKLERENKELKERNGKLQKRNNILMRAMEIALTIKSCDAQTKFLKQVLERIKQEIDETRGDRK